MQNFGKYFDDSVNCKNLFRKTIWAPKTASAGERPVSSLGCAVSLRSTKSNSSDNVAVAKHVLEAAVQSFDCTVLLRVVSCCLFVRNVKHFAKVKPKAGSILRTMIRSDPFRHFMQKLSKLQG